MICEKCGAEYDIVESKKVLKDKELCPIKKVNGTEIKIPFTCNECGSIFLYRFMGDKVIVFEDKVSETYDNTSIHIPDTYKEHYKSGFGFVIGIGPGFVNDRYKFINTTLRIGQRVLFDVTVPWNLKFKALDGKEYPVRLMGEQDIFCVIEDYD